MDEIKTKQSTIYITSDQLEKFKRLHAQYISKKMMATNQVTFLGTILDMAEEKINSM